MLDLNVGEIRRDPFPHVVKDNFIAADLYEALRRSFPECPANSGPTGYSYFWGDREYDELIAGNSAWKTLFELTQSQAFVDYCLDQFADVFQEYRCTIDLERARYVPYCESRADKERRYLANTGHEAHELWVRTDILQGKTGYSRQPHLDHRRRLVALLVYCCDADENRMEGGELVLHAGKPGRAPWDAEAVISPRHNRMVAFACSNDSFHSVPAIRSQLAPRNFIQIGLSSSVDAWPDYTTRLDALKATIRSLLHPRRRLAPVGN